MKKVLIFLALVTIDSSVLAATVGSNEKQAIDIYVGSAKSVKLVECYDPEWNEYTGSGVCYMQATLKKGKTYTLYYEGGDAEELSFTTYPREETDLEWDRDIYRPSANFVYCGVQDGKYMNRVYSTDWWEDDQASWKYYICLEGDIGARTTVHLVEGYVSFLSPGLAEKPLVITVGDKEQKFAKKFTEESAFFFETTLQGGRKYLVRIEGGSEGSPYSLGVSSDDMFEQIEDTDYDTSINDAWMIFPEEGGTYTFEAGGGIEGDDFVLVCSMITSITMPNGALSIEDGAFAGCNWITSVTIPSSVMSIGLRAFDGCSRLREFIVDSGDVTRIKELLVESGLDVSNIMFVERISDGGPYTEVVDGIEWTFFISNGEAELYNGYYPVIPDSTAGAITIPSKLGNCPVTSIGGSAFAGCSALTSVTIPSSVMSIGWYAFWECSALASVTIPDGVTSIGEGAFSGCSSLTSVTIPSSVTSIGSGAFVNCSALTSVTIPSSVTSIGEGAFSGCTGLKTVCVSSGDADRVKSLMIGKGVDVNTLEFVEPPKPDGGPYTQEVDGIVWTYMVKNGEASVGGGSSSSPAVPTTTTGAITIPSTLGGYPVTSIGWYAFYRCSALTSVTIPSSVTSIGYEAFYGCSSLTSVTIPSSVTSIGSSAFENCSALTSVTIPSSVTSIGNAAFSGCSSLTSVTIPSSVTSIGDSAFSGCRSLTSVTIPSSVTSIGLGAFWGCSALTSVTIPSSVTSIGDSAFNGCSALTSVTIPACVTSLQETFPDAWTKIENVVVSDGVTLIDEWTFMGYSGLKSIVIPESVTRIGDRAFYDCSNLSSIEFKGDAPDFGMEVFSGTPKRMVISVAEGSIGWDGGISSELPETFNGRAIVHSGSHYEWKGGGEQTTPSIIGGATSVALTTTNVVVHYVLNGIVPEAVTPTIDNALVAIYTEVKGDAVAIPQSWAEQFPQFEEKFGTDFVKALTMETGKKGAGGAPMLVWHDFVAGTDPTNLEDTFKASITFDKETGKPIISWTPEVKDESGKYLRKYTVYGKAKLTDEQWKVVPEGREDDYNFFKVTVEML